MPQVQDSQAPPWSDLLPELLGLVFLRLPTRTDRAFFAAVCRMWCSAARRCRLPPPSPVPWLLLPDGSATSFPGGETFQLPDGMHYHTFCGEWILLSLNDGSLLLMNHFTKATMPLPSLSSYSHYQEPVEAPQDYMAPGIWDTWLENTDRNEICVTSLVVCSTRLIAAIVDIGSFRTIALCRPGAGAWSVSPDVFCQLSDMVFLQGKIYALDHTTGPGDLIAIDIVDENDSEPRVSRIEHLIEGISLSDQELFIGPYFLESHGTLLMIYKKVSYKIERGPEILVTTINKFVVFQADLERHLWVEMRTLGNDQALFLGPGCSRAVHVSPYDVSRDCIFYVRCFGNSKKAGESCGCELYDMKDGKTYSPIPLVSWKSGKVPLTWIFSQGVTDKAANSREVFTENCGT